MEIELEMMTQSKDFSEVLQKITQVVTSAKQQGFEINELEIEAAEEEDKEG